MPPGRARGALRGIPPRFPGYEARYLCPTWKRMKMRSGWGILEAEPTRRGRGVLVLLSPITKLIQVRPRTNDCRPSREVSTQAKLVFPSHRSLAAHERSKGYGGLVSALLWLGHPQKDDRGLRAADRGRRHAPAVRAPLWGPDRRSVGSRALGGLS